MLKRTVEQYFTRNFHFKHFAKPTSPQRNDFCLIYFARNLTPGCKQSVDKATPLSPPRVNSQKSVSGFARPELNVSTFSLRIPETSPSHPWFFFPDFYIRSGGLFSADYQMHVWTLIFRVYAHCLSYMIACQKFSDTRGKYLPNTFFKWFEKSRQVGRG